MASGTLNADPAAVTITAVNVELVPSWITPSYWLWGDGTEILWGDGEILELSLNYETNYDSASISLSAQSVDFTHQYQINSDQAFVIIGARDVDLSVGTATFIDVDPAQVQVSGQDVNLLVDWKINADAASVSVSAPDILLQYSQNTDILADNAIYLIGAPFVGIPPSIEEFFNVQLYVGYQVNIDPAAFSVTAANVELQYGLTLNADAAAFTVDAKAVELERPQQLEVTAIRVQIAAGDANFLVGGTTQVFGKFDSTNIIKRETVSDRAIRESVGQIRESERVGDLIEYERAGEETKVA